MAANRHRLRHLAKRGNKNAITTMWLLDRVEKLLAVILITNTLTNALSTALVTVIAISTFGNNQTVITIATAIVAFLLKFHPKSLVQPIRNGSRCQPASYSSH